MTNNSDLVHNEVSLLRLLYAEQSCGTGQYGNYLYLSINLESGPYSHCSNSVTSGIQGKSLGAVKFVAAKVGCFYNLHYSTSFH